MAVSGYFKTGCLQLLPFLHVCEGAAGRKGAGEYADPWNQKELLRKFVGDRSTRKRYFFYNKHRKEKIFLNSENQSDGVRIKLNYAVGTAKQKG